MPDARVASSEDGSLDLLNRLSLQLEQPDYAGQKGF